MDMQETEHSNYAITSGTLRERQLDLDLWQKLYYKYQKDYVRKRLLAIKYLYEGKNRTKMS